MKKFSEWIKNNDKKQCLVAARLSISSSSLNDILRLGRMPSIRVACEIEKYTNGEITIYDWIDHDVENKMKGSKKKKTKKTERISR